MDNRERSRGVFGVGESFPTGPEAKLPGDAWEMLPVASRVELDQGEHLFDVWMSEANR